MDKVEVVFNLYKDSVVVSKPFRAEVVRKYQLTKEQARDLYIRIQNYQIEKYGERITYDKTTCSSEERKTLNRNATQRKYEKKARRYDNKKLLDNLFGDVLGQVDILCQQAKELK